MSKTVKSLKLLPVKHQRALGPSQNQHFRFQNSIKIGSKIGPAAEPSPEPVFSDFGLQNGAIFGFKFQLKLDPKLVPPRDPLRNHFFPFLAPKRGSKSFAADHFWRSQNLTFWVSVFRSHFGCLLAASSLVLEAPEPIFACLRAASCLVSKCFGLLTCYTHVWTSRYNTRWFDQHFASLPKYDERLAPQYRYEPPSEFPQTAPFSGMV